VLRNKLYSPLTIVNEELAGFQIPKEKAAAPPLRRT
jgi:hypothetical protein